MKINDAVIISGGLGSRMSPLTEYIPKPLVRVNGLPLIKHVIDFLKKNNISNINITYGYKGDLLLNEIWGEVNTCINTNNKDNAYFLFNSFIREIDRPIIVCPCDMIVDIDINEIKKDYDDLGSPVVCIIPVRTTMDADGLIINNNIVKKISRDTKSDIYASGIQVINPYKLNRITNKFDNFYDVWNFLIEKQLLYVSNIYPNKWKIFDKLSDLT